MRQRLHLPTGGLSIRQRNRESMLLPAPARNSILRKRPRTAGFTSWHSYIFHYIDSGSSPRMWWWCIYYIHLHVMMSHWDPMLALEWFTPVQNCKHNRKSVGSSLSTSQLIVLWSTASWWHHAMIFWFMAASIEAEVPRVLTVSVIKTQLDFGHQCHSMVGIELSFLLRST